MNAKKTFWTIVISMSLLAAFGVWVLISSAATYKNRPRLNVKPYIYNNTTITQTVPLPFADECGVLLA